MEDPVKGHPTRKEQLDILASLVADHCRGGDQILELGVGVGYVASLIFAKNANIGFVGVDRKTDSLQAVPDYNQAQSGKIRLVAGDLEDIGNLDIPPGPYRFVYTALTFHDLPDKAKQAVIQWAAARLDTPGYFLLYDRLRLTEVNLFPLQQSIWNRIEREYGASMRTADNYGAYIEDLGTDNRPATMADYENWFAAAGLSMQVLHLHGNVALFAGARK